MKSSAYKNKSGKLSPSLKITDDDNFSTTGGHYYQSPSGRMKSPYQSMQGQHAALQQQQQLIKNQQIRETNSNSYHPAGGVFRGQSPNSCGYNQQIMSQQMQQQPQHLHQQKLHQQYQQQKQMAQQKQIPQQQMPQQHYSAYGQSPTRRWSYMNTGTNDHQGHPMSNQQQPLNQYQQQPQVVQQMGYSTHRADNMAKVHSTMQHYHPSHNNTCQVKSSVNRQHYHHQRYPSPRTYQTYHASNASTNTRP